MTGVPVSKVAIVGNPNVGKSLVFSRCTGTNVISANYPGTTVGTKRCRLSDGSREYELIDMPGLYSFGPGQEAIATLIDECDVVVNIIDATTLERNLNLTLQLLRRNKPMLVCLNIWDETAHKGIAIDHEKLADLLGVPVVPASALSGDGIRELVAALPHARLPAVHFPEEDVWQVIGTQNDKFQRL
jgi:ferrous iron transport protein B